MWIAYALLSAVFAALTAIFAKIGIADVNSTLATAIRTVVVLLAAWGMVFLTGAQRGIGGITPRGWLFLALSGLCDRRLLALLLQGTANRRHRARRRR